MSVDVLSIPCVLAMPVVGPRGPSKRLADVISALTYALDLTEGERSGHALRTALIAMRVGRAPYRDNDRLRALYYAALLKDSGGSSTAARLSALFGGDDQDVKHDMRMVDWHDRWRLARRTPKNCGVGRHPIARLSHVLSIACTPSMTRTLIRMRGERGAQIALVLGFPRPTSQAIRFRNAVRSRRSSVGSTASDRTEHVVVPRAGHTGIEGSCRGGWGTVGRRARLK
jgi:hypothetical protein